MTQILASVTAYKGMLVLELKATESSKDVAITRDQASNRGQVILNTKRNLGVSPQALELLNSVRGGNSFLGDIAWFRNEAHDIFSWLGGPFSIKDPAKCGGARVLAIGSHVVIDNEPAKEAMDCIDERLEAFAAMA